MTDQVLEKQPEATEAPEDEVDFKALYEEGQKQQEKLKDLANGLMPTEASEAVNDAKRNGVQPYCIQIGEDFFIYRTISRMEYRKLLTDQADVASRLMEDAPNEMAGRVAIQLRNEDALVLKCLLFPAVNEMTIKQLPAGYVETLNQNIMATSGFGQEPVPIKL